MRWDNLFDDLESQLEQGLTAEEIDLHAEEERLRLGRLSLRSRIAAIHEAETRESRYSIRMVLRGGETIAVRPVAFGRDWFSADLIDQSDRRSQCVVPLDAISGVVLTRGQIRQSLRPAPREAEQRMSDRLGFGFVLRDLCRRRREVALRLADGEVHGTIDRVGREHLDLAVHDPGVARRESAVSHYRLVPLAHVLLVRL
jgi:hypothetical protein